MSLRYLKHCLRKDKEITLKIFFFKSKIPVKTEKITRIINKKKKKEQFFNGLTPPFGHETQSTAALEVFALE